jgi:hypothetical protein
VHAPQRDQDGIPWYPVRCHALDADSPNGTYPEVEKALVILCSFIRVAATTVPGANFPRAWIFCDSAMWLDSKLRRASDSSRLSPIMWRVTGS